MRPSLEKLRKFFRLEHSNGYTDNAVIGGLAKTLDIWEGEARNDGLPEDVIQSVGAVLRGYGDQDPEARAESLQGLWKQIGEKMPEAAPVSRHASKEPLQEDRLQVAVADIPPAAQPAVPDEMEAAPVPAPAPERTAARPEPRGPGRAEGRPGGITSKTPIALNASLTVLAGVGPRHAAMLARLGLNTLGDMLYYFPRRYDDYSQLKPIHDLFYGQQVTVIGTVISVHPRQVRGGKMSIFEGVINDGTGGLRLTWFNQPWLANRLKVGEAISVSGVVQQYLGRLVMNNPDWEPVEAENLSTNRIVPVYPLTANVTQKWLRRLVHQVVTYWAPKLTDHLPDSIRRSAGLIDLSTALLQVHRPETQDQLHAARQRLAFDEIFFLQMGVQRQKRDWKVGTARVFEVLDDWLAARLAVLPFTLTEAQRRAVAEVRSDLKSGTPMNRLLQGDVGSGKTVVAALASAIVARSGAQSAIMAPTSILADQHYRSFVSLLAGEETLQPEAIRLLIGDTPEREKEAIRAGLASGEIKILIGTHALLEGPITFSDLQFVVIDEQHRFGVEQRASLRSKGTSPHLLVMTATPIPRSLALTVYGDLDLSVMDEMPAGRQSTETHVLFPTERERAYSLIRGQIASGHQAFIVYPLVEESEKSELLAATEEHERLQKEIFPDLRLGLLHGRMRPEEKDAVMLAFRACQYDLLVSTTVVEVGVDIPNATVMLVEGANHFGLAQLHQLRGRVGRGETQSFCLLIPDHDDAMENERLAAMAETNDGFVLAELDLKQRGPGEFLGTRQAGYASSLRMASLSDIAMIEKARLQAQGLFERDPDLKEPEHQLLAEALQRFWSGGKGDVS
ncbi:MAG: ATP-dependent DNA helicase RecG [Anaerolineales bacterium]|jgi:ATP-dependent DNA helicase RecG